MEDYVQKFQNIVNQINTDSKHVLIVNAGSMNLGKSDDLEAQETYRRANLIVFVHIRLHQDFDQTSCI